ncbi:kinase-like domain-containing protein [Coprinopsis sp. MPI-PUGE-AT-0042]|nr:kinase-like domain-containing protein [Coprinopsis sp. MPI-PUGE-AT-0042]
MPSSETPSNAATHSPSTAGHYHAVIPQGLDGHRYTVVRKLACGHRSSTWLARGNPRPTIAPKRSKELPRAQYCAVKIYTVSASKRAETEEVPILQLVSGRTEKALPMYYHHFWEESPDGKHLCVVILPTSTSIRVMQHEQEDHKLAVHAVQKIVYEVVEALKYLHGVGIMQGGLKAENIAFITWSDLEVPEPIPTTEPQCQPLEHTFVFKKRKPGSVLGWVMHLTNFGHSQRNGYKPEEMYDYYSAPETLLSNPSCSPATDIWMLGYMAFNLLTGTLPFKTESTPSQILSQMFCALSEAPASLPQAFKDDPKMEGVDAIAEQDCVPLWEALVKALHGSDVAEAASFIKACMRMNPEERLSAKELAKHKWLSCANACECCYW